MAQLLDLIKDSGKSAIQIISDLVDSQKSCWPLAAANYAGLEKVELKQFQFDNYRINVQYNPERLLSTSSKTDHVSIAARPCFLCEKNRPEVQESIDFGDDLKILINPFPIFKLHLTIVGNEHVEQRFLINAPKMLGLAESLQGFTIIYNGPECGASAPDHFHFQAGESTLMPIAEEFERLKDSERLIFSGTKTKVFAFSKYIRKMISIKTESAVEGIEIINLYFRHFQAMQPDKAEPMMNALCAYENGKWKIHLFPRKAHRPSQYFATGSEQILISPGSVDFGGLFITPRHEDFLKISKEDVFDILDQVCLDQEVFSLLASLIEKDLSNYHFK
jgi:ATP adenylyltransferase/5',5'''-P-1,P-4-tetraphosphate phosphorylase II